MRTTFKYRSRPQPEAKGPARGGKAGVRAAGWTALLAAALLGAGMASADECSDEWDESTAATYCGDANDSVTVANVSGTTRCSVDIACYHTINTLNGPNGDGSVTFYVSNPGAWVVQTDDEGNQITNGLARTDVDDITICYYSGSLTDENWVDWRDKLVAGSCASGEIDITDADANGLDMRASELD